MRNTILVSFLFLCACGDPSPEYLAKCHAQGRCQDQAVTPEETAYISKKQAEWAALTDQQKAEYQRPQGSNNDALLYGFMGYMIGSNMGGGSQSSRSTTTNNYYTGSSSSSSSSPSRSYSSGSTSRSSSYGGSSSYSGGRSSGSSYGGRR